MNTLATPKNVGRRVEIITGVYKGKKGTITGIDNLKKIIFVAVDGVAGLVHYEFRNGSKSMKLIDPVNVYNPSTVKSLRGARVEILKGFHQGKKGTISSFNIKDGKKEVIVRVDGFTQVESYPADSFNHFFNVIEETVKKVGKPAKKKVENPLFEISAETTLRGKFVNGPLNGWTGYLQERNFDRIKVLLTDHAPHIDHEIAAASVGDVVIYKHPSDFKLDEENIPSHTKVKQEESLWDEMVNDPKRVHHLTVTINAEMKTQLVIFVPALLRYDEENEDEILDLLIDAVKKKVEEEGGTAVSRFREYTNPDDEDDDPPPDDLDEPEEEEEEEEEDVPEDEVDPIY